MNTVALAQSLTRLSGVVLIVLGVAFWTGNLYNLVLVHIVAGVVLVLAFWALALAGLRRGIPARTAALAVAWGLFVLIFGWTHPRILPGPAHWVIEVLHFLVGLATVGMGERLGARVRQDRSPGVRA